MLERVSTGRSIVKGNGRSVFGIGLLASFIFLGGGNAPASDQWPPLESPAIAARAPDKVMLDAVSRAGNRLVAVGEHGVIIYSDDSGRNWTQAVSPVSVLLTDVKFATPTQGWAVGHYGVVLHTTDSGATWTLRLNGIQANQLTLAAADQFATQSPASPAAQVALRRANIFIAAGPDKPFFSILAERAEDVTVFGAYRLAMRSVDGGKTWQDWSLHIGDPYSHNLYDVATVGSQIYIASEGGRIFCSTDRGNTYPATTQPTDTTMFGVIGIGDHAALVFGVAGRAYRSQDGGKTWQVPMLDAGANLTAATVLRSGAVVVVGEDGTIYVSYDHANTFTPLPEVQQMPLYGVAQAPDGDVIVVGALGVMVLPSQAFSQH